MSSDFFNVEYFDNPVTGEVNLNNNCFRLCYCQRGRLTHNINDTSTLLFHGDAFIVPPDVIHRTSVSVPHTVCFIISFDVDFVNNENNKFLSGLKNDMFLPAKITLVPEEIVFFENAMYKIFGEFTSRQMNYKNIIKSCLDAILDIIHRSIHNQQKASLPDMSSDFYSKEKMIKYCVSYIDTHCCDSISLSDITKLSAMSRSLFCSLFKKETGLSFNDYINRKRIQKALVLLRSNEKITEIAYMCGYTETSTFYRNFNKFTSYTPVEYRKLFQDPDNIMTPPLKRANKK